MILFLFLLLTISWEAKSTEFPQIDWSRCKVNGVKCYIYGECDSFYQDPAKEEHYGLHNYAVANRLINGKCRIGVQTIPFSESKVLFYIQVNGEDLNDRKIGLYEVDATGTRNIIVGCEKKDDEVMRVINHPTLMKKAKPVLYEDFSHFGEKSALCAVTIDQYDKILNKIIDPSDPGKKTVLLFDPLGVKTRTGNNLPELGVVGYTDSYTIYNTATVMFGCDPGLIKSVPPREDWHVVSVKDKARTIMDCNNYKKDFGVNYDYKLIIVTGGNENDNEKEVDQLVCKSETKNGITKFEYIGKVKNKPLTDPVTYSEIPILNQAEFSAYCRAKITMRCTAPACKGDNCPTFTEATDTDDPKLECKKWLINDEYQRPDANIVVKCEQDDLRANEASFFANSTKLTANDRCFDKYDCNTKSNLVLGSGVVANDETMYCEKGTMKVISDDSEHNTTQRYTCRKKTGSWIDGAYEIKTNSRVFCQETQVNNNSQINARAGEANLSDGQVYGIIAAIVVGVLIAVGLAAYFIFKFCLGRNSRKIILNFQIKKWKSMKRNKRMQIATKIFNDASLASRTSKTHIIHGLELVDQMLISECEQPEIWALAYPFLDRFHGASRTRGNRITGLLTRYLYLQAKRIIDKHGWKSPTPITKTKPKGYIRAVAIRLIYYCRFNAYTPEMTKFIGEGFEKLRYDAVAQYPHCGLLWAHVGSCRDTADFIQRNYWDLITIANKLYKVPMEIPEADRFDDIGDISEQAYFALGSSLFYEQKYSFYISTSVKRHSLFTPFVDGILRSSNLDMGITLRKLFCSVNLKSLRTVFDNDHMDGFVYKAMRAMICYGQGQDAKRLENLYLNPHININTDADRDAFRTIPPGPRFSQMSGEQKRFEGALSVEEKDLLEWLAKRMDKAALKDPMANHHKVNGNTAAAIVKSESSEAPKTAPESASADIDPKTGVLKDEFFFDALIKDPKAVPRIRKPTATEDEQKRFRALLDQIWQSDSLNGLRIDFAPDDIWEVVLKMKEIVKTEPMLIEDIPAGITVVTDIHGQLYDVDRILKTDSVDGKPGYECAKFLFLGDYVDRGDQSLEVVMALFILKILYPDTVYVLRGNHEFVHTNKGTKKNELRFLKEINERYQKSEAMEIYCAINDCFCYLSLAGIIGDKYFCVHGGITIGSFTRHEMRRLEKPLFDYSLDPMVQDLMWADPAIGLKGVCYQNTREAGAYFGEDEFIHAMENVGCEAMIRGHQVMLEGYEVVWNRVFCVFTASGTAYRMKKLSKGAFAVVDENLDIRCRLLVPDQIRYDLDKVLLKTPCDDSGAVSTRENGTA